MALLEGIADAGNVKLMNQHLHQFIPTWQVNCTLVRWCSCGETQQCTLQELKNSLLRCMNIRSDCFVESSKTKSKSREQEFVKAMLIKNRQIAWLENEIKQRK